MNKIRMSLPRNYLSGIQDFKYQFTVKTRRAPALHPVTGTGCKTAEFMITRVKGLVV